MAITEKTSKEENLFPKFYALFGGVGVAILFALVTLVKANENFAIMSRALPQITKVNGSDLEKSR